jgi:acetamidase/formamidase
VDPRLEPEDVGAVADGGVEELPPLARKARTRDLHPALARRLVSLGDTHAAQGDGEVCGTAIEAAMEVVVRLSVRRDFSVDAPQYHLPASAADIQRTSFHVCTGVGPDIMEATKDSVRATIAHLGHRYGLDREVAYALASVACDLRIHEVVDVPNWVVGCFLPESIFTGGE